MNILNDGMARMLKGGVIMDVSSVEEAIIAEKSGACAVMALDMIPSKIRKQGGIARMSNIGLIRKIKESVNIPVMAKCRIGHEIEARLLEQIEIDFIDESEVLTPADYDNHIEKNKFKIPFVCGAKNLGEALRRISEGATMIRTKGEAGTGDVSHAVKHWKAIKNEIYTLKYHSSNFQLNEWCAKQRVSRELLDNTLEEERLTVVTFAAGGIATPADASLMMHLGVDGIFVGSGIFESSDPEKMAHAISLSTSYYDDYGAIVRESESIDKPMKGVDTNGIEMV